MTREVDSIIAVHLSSGTPGIVTDINTANIHASKSWHYRPANQSLTGKISTAVDFGNRPVKLTDEQALEVFEAFKPYAETGQLSELFCGQADWCVYNGNWLRWTSLPKKIRDAIRPEHMNHVHVAVRVGTFLKAHSLAFVETDMPQPFTLMAPSGRGRWTLFPDGRVETSNFDAKNPIPFFGSMFDYPKERSPGRVFTNMQMIPREDRSPKDGDGYVIFSNDKGAFLFPNKK